MFVGITVEGTDDSAIIADMSIEERREYYRKKKEAAKSNENDDDEEKDEVENPLKASKELHEYELENMATKERQKLINTEEFQDMPEV